LISGLLIAALAAFAFVGYQQLTGALVVRTKDRLGKAVQLLAKSVESNVPQLRADMDKTAADSAVRRVLRTNDASTRAAAERVLADNISKIPQAIAFELRDRNGKRLLWVAGPAAAKSAPLRDGHVESSAPKGLMVGPIVADRGALFYEAAVPIAMPAGDTIGSLTQFREVSSGAGAQLIGSLIGSDATLLFSSPGGRWNNLATIVPGPPVTPNRPLNSSYTASDGSTRVGASALVKNTPWVIWVDVRSSAVLAPAWRFLEVMALAGLLILIAGAVAAWLISRQISAPLKNLSDAARDISAGDYSRRADVHREDELGFLADSFNNMARQIEEAHHGLEVRVRERTKELETALGELHEAQETLVRKEKLATLGLLAGGVGHELRNPLGVMTNAIYYLGAVMKEAPAEIKEYLEILRTQIALSEKIVGDLLDFARIKPPQWESVTLRQIVDAQLARAGALEAVRIEHDFPADLPAVRVDRVQMGQVVLNLIMNALQAMNGHAVLTFRGRHTGAGVVRLDVIDTGMGMTPEQMRRLFEPLFTTKARGIGLGLAVSQGLVRANGGTISAESKHGTGTTMSISLPASDPRAP
jgi:signal transduction histidine kinase